MLNIKVTKPRKLYMKECDIILVFNLWVLTTHTHTEDICMKHVKRDEDETQKLQEVIFESVKTYRHRVSD